MGADKIFEQGGRPKPQDEKNDDNDEEGQPSFVSLSAPSPLPVYIANNVYFNRAIPYKKEKGAKVYEDSGIEYTIDWKTKRLLLK